MTADGGFRTGDLGYLDEGGFLFITGRIKEQYKLENGRYVAPGPLEEQIKLSPFISNVFVYGDNRVDNVALVVPNFDALRIWATRQGIPVDSDERLCQNPRIIGHLQAEVDKASDNFKGFERMTSSTSEEFTTQNAMLYALAQGEATCGVAEIRPTNRGPLRRRDGEPERCARRRLRPFDTGRGTHGFLLATRGQCPRTPSRRSAVR